MNRGRWPQIRWAAPRNSIGQRWKWVAPEAARTASHRNSGMDMTWVTGRIAVGGGIWNAENMAEVARSGVTHIIDMQQEFDDTPLADPFGIEVLWNPTEDDFQPKPPALFQRGVDFAKRILDEPETKLFVHCAAGIHRAPTMTLAILASLSWTMQDAMLLIERKREMADFAEVYVRSVERFLEQQGKLQRVKPR